MYKYILILSNMKGTPQGARFKAMINKLNTLPKEVQDKVKNTLKAYDEAHVIFEYGEYHVSVGVALKASYGADHKVIGTFKANEIYTDDERIENYINTFQDYPIEYKGKRDYKTLNDGKRHTWKLIDGVLVAIA